MSLISNETNIPEQSIQLKDGRRLGFHDYGAKNGFPILALHGTPGSRIWFKQDDQVSEKLEIRLITIDRPGYGLSSSKKDRKIIDFNHDLNELISQLKLQEFSIFGVSGGGAYALAYASTGSKKLVKVGIVASAYEFENKKIPSAMCKPNRAAFFLAKRFPWILKYAYKNQKYLIDSKPETYQKSARKHISHLCKSDQEILINEETSRSLLVHLKEAFRSTAYEAVNELKLLRNPWHIDLSKISAKVEVWHGEQDTLSPINGLKTFIKTIPNKQTHFISKKGHFLDEDAQLWEAILKSLKPNS